MNENSYEFCDKQLCEIAPSENIINMTTGKKWWLNLHGYWQTNQYRRGWLLSLFRAIIVSGHQLFLISSNYTINFSVHFIKTHRKNIWHSSTTFHFSPNYVTMPNLHLPVLARLNITLTWVTKPLPYFTERHARMQCLCNKGSKPQGIINKLQHKSVNQSCTVYYN